MKVIVKNINLTVAHPESHYIFFILLIFNRYT